MLSRRRAIAPAFASPDRRLPTRPAPISSVRGSPTARSRRPGASRVPGAGQPTVVLAARQTVGGYVKIATVIGADLDRLAQLRPAAPVRFAAVAPEDARAETLQYRAALGPEAVVVAPPFYSG